jgi:phospholipid/cholesterol/gamma-HCH transport system substrate-binding protein
METKVNTALVGAFVLALGAALVAGVLWLASGGGFQEKPTLYLALVGESVAGLNVNAPVKYRGVDVGKVRTIQLAPGNPEQVRLVFAIDRGTPIKEDTEAVLKTQGLTGIAYVELDGGTLASPLLRASAPGELAVIRTKPSLSARLENVLTTVLAKLDATSENVNKILSDDNLASFKSTLADLSAVARTLAANQGVINAGLANAARTFDNSARASARIGPLVAQVGRSAEAFERMSNETALASANAAGTIDAVGADLQRFTGETLPELERLLGELNVLSASLRRLSEKVEGSPGGLLWGRRPVPPGPGE